MTAKRVFLLTAGFAVLAMSLSSLAPAQNAPATWFAATAVTIPSDKGPLMVQKQTANIGGHSVDLVYSPTHHAAWIGPRADCYFGLTGMIWSCSVRADQLVMHASSGSVAPDQVSGYADQWVVASRAQPSKLAPYTDTIGYDLEVIFGRQTLVPARSSAVWFRTLRNISVNPAGDRVVFDCESIVSNKLELVCSTNLDLLAASINGEPILVLQDGKLADGRRLNGWIPWSGPTTGSVISPAGPVAAAGCRKSLSGSSGKRSRTARRSCCWTPGTCGSGLCSPKWRW